MDTMQKPAAVAVEVEQPGRIRRLVSSTRNRASLIVGALAVALMVVPNNANADTGTDPTGGAGDTFFSGLTSYLQGHLISSVLLLAVIGVSVSMLLAWGKKAAKSK